MSFQTDWYAWIIAHEYNFLPVEGAKYDALDLPGQDWNFVIAKEYGDNSNCLFAIDGDALEQG